jgi:hypothetical protein
MPRPKGKRLVIYPGIEANTRLSLWATEKSTPENPLDPADIAKDMVTRAVKDYYAQHPELEASYQALEADLAAKAREKSQFDAEKIGDMLSGSWRKRYIWGWVSAKVIGEIFETSDIPDFNTYSFNRHIIHHHLSPLVPLGFVGQDLSQRSKQFAPYEKLDHPDWPELSNMLDQHNT